MSFITLKCKNCGSQMSLNTESHSATCTHCGSTFLLADLLDEQDIKITEASTPKDIEKKLSAGEELKKGETCIFQANYEEAEQHFKKAIEYDDKNFRAYLGVVKAKTQNLNVIPNNDDYLEYAKCAMHFASFEDQVYVKSELAKIELLKREDIRQKKAKRVKARHEELKKNKKREINKFFTKITIIISVIFVVGILLGNFLFGKDKGWDKMFNSTIDVTTATQFIEALNSDENKSVTINIKKDLDFDNASINPIGSASKPFSGKVNGNGHTIKNVIISTQESGTYNYYGLFGCLSNATISNLVLDNIVINSHTDSSQPSSNCYGILAGMATNTVIKNVKTVASGTTFPIPTCEISIIKENITSSTVGGLVGKITSSTRISNVAVNTYLTTDYANSTNVATVYHGGIAGYVDKSFITSSLYDGEIEPIISNTNASNTFNLYVGGIAGYVNDEATDTSEFISKNVSTATIETLAVNQAKANQNIGGIVGHGANLNAKATNYCYISEENISKNTNPLEQNELEDYSASNLFAIFTDDTDTITSKLAEIFPAKEWEVVGTTVNLKK